MEKVAVSPSFSVTTSMLQWKPIRQSATHCSFTSRGVVHVTKLTKELTGRLLYSRHEVLCIDACNHWKNSNSTTSVCECTELTTTAEGGRSRDYNLKIGAPVNFSGSQTKYFCFHQMSG